MKPNEMIERYVYAATKNLPNKIRRDVEQEIESIILDMLEERCGDLRPTDQDVRIVLAQIGTPAQLAEKYNPDHGKYLVGPGYYAKYKFVMKIVLLSVLLGMTIATILSSLVTECLIWYQAIGNWITSTIGALLFAFSVVTIVFAVLEYKKVDMKFESDSIDNLPPVPKKKQQISKSECVVGIVFSIVFTVVFLVCPQICTAVTKDGTLIPIFNIDALRSTWYIIIIFALLGIVQESVKLLDRRYTMRVMLVTLVTNTMTAILAYIWLYGINLMNAEFIGYISGLFQGEEQWIATIFSHLQLMFLGVLLFALILDTVITLFQTLRNKEQ